MSIKSRLDRLQRHPALRPRTFIICPVEDPGEVPGTIDVWSNGEGANMCVPAEFSMDPEAGLDDRQRAFIQPGDMLMLLTNEIYKEGEMALGESCLTWGDESN